MTYSIRKREVMMIYPPSHNITVIYKKNIEIYCGRLIKNTPHKPAPNQTQPSSILFWPEIQFRL